MAEKNYSAASLQVLSGLEPVRRRPGMYTDTTRPNHLVQEVVDNSVDEAIAGFCREIEVTLRKDGSVEVIDDVYLMRRKCTTLYMNAMPEPIMMYRMAWPVRCPVESS